MSARGRSNLSPPVILSSITGGRSYSDHSTPQTTQPPAHTWGRRHGGHWTEGIFCCRERAAGEWAAFCPRETTLQKPPLPKRAPGTWKPETHSLHVDVWKLPVGLHLKAFPLHPTSPEHRSCSASAEPRLQIQEGLCLRIGRMGQSRASASLLR